MASEQSKAWDEALDKGPAKVEEETPVVASEETATEDSTPADTPKPTAKEKATGVLHQTTDKIKATVANVKEKVTPAKH